MGQVTNLALQVAFVLLVESPQTVPVGPLGVCINVHLYHPVAHLQRLCIERINRLSAYRFPDLGSRGPAATVHDEVEGLLLGALQLLLRKVLVPFQQLGGQHHVASLIGRECDQVKFASPPCRRHGRFQRQQRWRTWG